MILLDTVALIRLTLDQPLASWTLDRIRAAEVQGQLAVSAITAWELCILETTRATGPLLHGDGASFFARACELAELAVIPIDAAIAIGSRRLPNFPRKDPADRFIVATARVHDATLVTTDGPILNYAKLGHVKAFAC